MLIASLLISWKYLALFPLLIVEGFVVTIVAGFLVSVGTLSFYPTLAVVVIGDMCSDVIYYGLGYRGSNLLQTKWARMFGLTAQNLNKIEGLYSGHGGKILIIAKLTNALSLPAVVAAGLIKMPFRRFMLFCFAAAVPKALMLILIGYYFGSAYTDVSRLVEYCFLGATLAVLLLLGGWYLQKRLLVAAKS